MITKGKKYLKNKYKYIQSYFKKNSSLSVFLSEISLIIVSIILFFEIIWLNQLNFRISQIVFLTSQLVVTIVIFLASALYIGIKNKKINVFITNKLGINIFTLTLLSLILIIFINILISLLYFLIV